MGIFKRQLCQGLANQSLTIHLQIVVFLCRSSNIRCHTCIKPCIGFFSNSDLQLSASRQSSDPARRVSQHRGAYRGTKWQDMNEAMEISTVRASPDKCIYLFADFQLKLLKGRWHCKVTPPGKGGMRIGTGIRAGWGTEEGGRGKRLPRKAATFW